MYLRLAKNPIEIGSSGSLSDPDLTQFLRLVNIHLSWPRLGEYDRQARKHTASQNNRKN
jgi:hypothetical protein